MATQMKNIAHAAVGVADTVIVFVGDDKGIVATSTTTSTPS